MAEGKFRCRLCGRILSTEQSCCGQVASPAGQVHAEHPMGKWMCPVCGMPSDSPMTCCGKQAILNPRFREAADR